MTRRTPAPDDPALVAFWRERHLCTVSTVRADGSLHVTPMGVVLDPAAGVLWAVTDGGSVKARTLRANPTVAVCCVDGRWWTTVTGRATVLSDAESVAEAERRYAERYRVPRVNPHRVALRIEIDRIVGNLPD